MKLKKVEDLNDFLAAVDKAKGNVILSSVEGDRYNLKSTFSKYLAIAALLKDEYEKLELFCEYKSDEKIFIEFFVSHPGVL